MVPQSTTLTVGQQKAAALLSVPSIILSLMGSAAIIRTLRQTRRQWGPYERIILAMSLADIYATTNYILHMFLTPQGRRVWSVGSQTSCSMLGGSLQFAHLGAYFNTILCIHYFYTIVHGVSGQGIFRRIEPWLYVFAFVWSGLTTMAGFLLNAYRYSELSGFCWVVCYDCNDSGYMHCPQLIVGYAFAAPIMVCFLVIGYCIISITRHVKRTLQQHNDRSTVRQIRRCGSHDQNDWCNNKEASPMMTTPPSSPVVVPEAPVPGQAPDFTGKPNSGNSLLQLVASQARLYIGAYVCVALNPWTLFLLMYESSLIQSEQCDRMDAGRFFPIVALQSIFLPLQGLFNYTIFMRPRYMDLRAKNPNWSRWHTVCEIIANATYVVERNNGQRRRGAGTKTGALQTTAMGDESKETFRDESKEAFSGPTIMYHEHDDPSNHDQLY